MKLVKDIPIQNIKTELWQEYKYHDEFGITTPWYITNIGKVTLSYSVYKRRLYINGRMIDLLTDNNYVNFDDLYDVESAKEHFRKKANSLIKSKLNNTDFDLFKAEVTQIECSYNVQIKNLEKYIEFLNYLYLLNKNGKFRNYRNYTTEQYKKLNSSFYLKTKGDYKDDSLVNFCLNIYNKSDQLTNKRNKNLEEFQKSNIKLNEIEDAKNIIRIECKVGYEYLKSICNKNGIQRTLENLFNEEISKKAIFHQIERFFTTGDFYSKKCAEQIIIANNIKIDLDTPFSELSEYKAKVRKKKLTELGICPYGFIPEKWGIDKMDNPIKLILNKKEKVA